MKDWKYIAYVVGAFALFLLVKMLSPKQYDWTVTMAHDDKDPYGTYALHDLMPALFAEDKISHSYLTLYELKDSLPANGNIVVFSTRFNPEEEDTKVLMQHVANGGNAFISAQYFWGDFPDTLDFGTNDYFFNTDNTLNVRDSSYLTLANYHMDTSRMFFYRRDNIHNYFDSFDTTRTTVVARNDNGQPVTIRVTWGKGSFILNSTPLVFTNIYLLQNDNNEFISAMLSHLPKTSVNWTEYYHMGRMESRTPLRFVLSSEPLRWAYYITILALLLFMIFEAKRRQRIIPVIKPMANTTLEFVSTIGNLYYQNGDHKNIAEKKIHYLLEHIRVRYHLPTNKLDDQFLKALAHKSGHDEAEIRALFKAANFVMSTTEISDNQLLDLNARVERFFSKPAAQANPNNNPQSL